MQVRWKKGFDASKVRCHPITFCVIRRRLVSSDVIGNLIVQYFLNPIYPSLSCLIASHTVSSCLIQNHPYFHLSSSALFDNIRRCLVSPNVILSKLMSSEEINSSYASRHLVSALLSNVILPVTFIRLLSGLCGVIRRRFNSNFSMVSDPYFSGTDSDPDYFQIILDPGL